MQMVTPNSSPDWVGATGPVSTVTISATSPCSTAEAPEPTSSLMVNSR